MEEERIKIIDESGDRKYFTQLPHYILNHSTANDQALYWQMKRYAGEDGVCFATQKTLMAKLGIGKKAYGKSLKYLISKEWIRFIGLTGGKTRPIKTYAINDIWKLNILNYEKISSERALSSGNKGDKSQKSTKISPKRAYIRITNIKNIMTRSSERTASSTKMNKFNDEDTGSVLDEEGNLIAPPEKKRAGVGPQMKDLVRWAIERRGKGFVNGIKQYTAIKKMRLAKITPAMIKERWIEMEETSFWRDNGFDFTNVANNFDKK